MNLLPDSDTKRYAARIIDQSVDEIYANYAHWLTNTVSLFTYHLDKVKLRIKVYFPNFRTGSTIFGNEYLAQKLQISIRMLNLHGDKMARWIQYQKVIAPEAGS